MNPVRDPQRLTPKLNAMINSQIMCEIKLTSVRALTG